MSNSLISPTPPLDQINKGWNDAPEVNWKAVDLTQVGRRQDSNIEDDVEELDSAVLIEEEDPKEQIKTGSSVPPQLPVAARRPAPPVPQGPAVRS